MIRTLALAAAATLVAGAADAQTIHVAKAGRSQAELMAEVRRAASDVCFVAAQRATMPLITYNSCLHTTMANARAQIGNPSMAVATGDTVVFR
jgi:hypothetical protein